MFKLLVCCGVIRKVSMNMWVIKLNCVNNDRVGEKVKKVNGCS